MEKRFVVLVPALLAWSAATSVLAAERVEKNGKKMPARRVAAIYFHRTQRCPTCKTISAYIEGAIKSEFAKQLNDRRVTLHMIDFQDRKNERYAKYYKITKPTLVVADVRDGKVKAWKPLPDVWTLVFKKPDFLKYVQKAVRSYLDAK